MEWLIILFGSLVALILHLWKYQEDDWENYPKFVKILYAINAMVLSYIYIVYVLLF